MSTEERREYYKKYRERNKEKVKQQKHEAYLRALERNPEYNVDRYKKWKEGNPEGNAKRYQKSLEKNPNFQKEHYEKYKEIELLLHKKNYATIEGRCAALCRKYRAADKTKGLDISQNINKEFLVNLIANNPCYYCGDSDWTHLGADRIDNTKPHTPENCLCSCFLCNVERQDKKTVEEFKQYRQFHPRALGTEKSFEIVEQNGMKILKKRGLR